MFDVPYIRSSQFDVASGQLVQGWTNDFLFTFYDQKGNYQRAFYYPFDKEPLTEENALAHPRLSGVPKLSVTIHYLQPGLPLIQW